MDNVLNMLYKFVGPKHNVHRNIKVVVWNLKVTWEKAMDELGSTNQCTATVTNSYGDPIAADTYSYQNDDMIQVQIEKL